MKTGLTYLVERDGRKTLVDLLQMDKYEMVELLSRIDSPNALKGMIWIILEAIRQQEKSAKDG